MSNLKHRKLRVRSVGHAVENEDKTDRDDYKGMPLKNSEGQMKSFVHLYGFNAPARRH